MLQGFLMFPRCFNNIMKKIYSLESGTDHGLERFPRAPGRGGTAPSFPLALCKPHYWKPRTHRTLESGTKLVSESGSGRKQGGWRGHAHPPWLDPAAVSLSGPAPSSLGYERPGGGSARSQDRKVVIS